jgi:hypothetical protein
MIGDIVATVIAREILLSLSCVLILLAVGVASGTRRPH